MSNAMQVVTFSVYSDFYAAAPLDLDYDEPNAVVQDIGMDFIAVPATESINQGGVTLMETEILEQTATPVVSQTPRTNRLAA